MAVITISEEYGSGGADIARQVVERLGYEFADKRTTDGIFRQYGLTKFDDLYSTAPNILDLLNADNLLLIAMANEIVEALAKRGNVVFLGRTGFAVLAGLADVLKVRVTAPFSERAQRVLDREGLASFEAATVRVQEDDDVHAKYVQRFYNKQWDAPANFDLVLDTSELSAEEAVAKIAAAAGELAAGKDAPRAASLEVDPVLADAVAKVLAYPLAGVSRE